MRFQLLMDRQKMELDRVKTSGVWPLCSSGNDIIVPSCAAARPFFGTKLSHHRYVGLKLVACSVNIYSAAHPPCNGTNRVT